MSRLFISGGGIVNSSLLGTGQDGPMHIAANTNLPVTADTGHIFLQLESLTIDAGATLKPANRCAGMVIVVRGDCVINGTISMDLMAPRRSDATEDILLTQGASSKWLKLISTLIGGKGGNGGGSKGGVGGNGHRFGGGYGGGGTGKHVVDNTEDTGNSASYYAGGASEPRPPASLIWPYTGVAREGSYGAGGGGGVTQSSTGRGVGGSAPGGGGGAYYKRHIEGNKFSDNYSNGAAGNAYGGGLLLLVVGGQLTLGSTGKLTAIGGNGGSGGDALGNSSTSVGYPGGGGGGGILALLAMDKRPQILGSMVVNGGTYATSAEAPGQVGNDGSIGTIYSGRINSDGTVMPW